MKLFANRPLALITGGALLALTALFASDIFFSVLLVAMAFSLVALSGVVGGCALAAVFLRRTRHAFLRSGVRALGILAVLALAMFGFTHGDWVHTLWNIQFSLAGLFFGSGILLLSVWPEERRLVPGTLANRNGAWIAFLAVALIGVFPLLLTLSPIEPWPPSNMEIAPLPALAEVAQYGFVGEPPEFLLIEDPPRAPGAPSHPPRFLTATIAAMEVAACFWILFVVLSFVSRAISSVEVRTKFLLLSPLVVAPVVLNLFLSKSWTVGIWENELWMPKAFGPLLLGAGLAALVLFVAVRNAESRAH